MKYFRYATDKKELTLYPLVCWHVGAHQSDETFIKETIRRIKDDPTARWIYLGDGGECNIKASKGDIYSQTMPPGEQLNYLKGLLRPVLDKGLFAVNGNHGRRIYKETGLDFDEELALRLHVPYFGVSALAEFVVARSHYHVFAHHGVSSGATISSKVNAAKKLNSLVVADVILSAHSHIGMALDPKHVAYIPDCNGRNKQGIRWRTTYEFICGCGYDSRTGYAETAAYSPILPSHVSVKLRGNAMGRRFEPEHTIWRAAAERDERAAA